MIRLPLQDGRDETAVLLANALPISRRGIMLTLESMGFAVKWATSSGLEAVSLCRSHRPRIAVLDIAMHDIDGLDLIRRCRREDTTLGIIVLADQANEHLIAEAMRVGADCFVLSHCGLEELEMALLSALNNERYICSRRMPPRRCSTVPQGCEQ